MRRGGGHIVLGGDGVGLTLSCVHDIGDLALIFKVEVDMSNLSMCDRGHLLSLKNNTSCM